MAAWSERSIYLKTSADQLRPLENRTLSGPPLESIAEVSPHRLFLLLIGTLPCSGSLHPWQVLPKIKNGLLIAAFNCLLPGNIRMIRDWIIEGFQNLAPAIPCIIENKKYIGPAPERRRLEEYR
jgi:hypothetical protein